MTQPYFFLTVLGFCLFLFTCNVIRFFLQMWEYKQVRKRFFDGKPKAWYPTITKPTLFFTNKKQINERKDS